MGRTALGFSIVIDPNFCSVYSGSVYQYLAGALRWSSPLTSMASLSTRKGMRAVY